MKRITVLLSAIILFLSATTCIASDKEELLKKANKIKGVYQAFFNANGVVERNKAEDLFFELFPSSFSELNSLYGFIDGEATPLYNYSEKHIFFFNEMKSINDTLYYKKLINTSIGGRWDADAIGFFQDGVREHVLKNKKLTEYLLLSYSDKDILSFWVFFFDGPHPTNATPSLAPYKSFDSRVLALLTKAYKQVCDESEEH